jgi:hypothetical protein
MKLLLSTVETYRVNTEDEVTDLIEEMKANAINYNLVSHASKYKEKKKKGIVVDSGYEVKIGKVYEQFWSDDI